MRVRLLVDITTDDLARLQRYVGEQPPVRLTFPDDRWGTWGRFVGAKEAVDGLESVVGADGTPRSPGLNLPITPTWGILGNFTRR